jgi:hypothetical protein
MSVTANVQEAARQSGVAVVLHSATARAILEHLRLPSRPLPLAPARRLVSAVRGSRLALA